MINQSFCLWFLPHLCVDDYHVLVATLYLSRVIHFCVVQAVEHKRNRVPLRGLRLGFDHLPIALFALRIEVVLGHRVDAIVVVAIRKVDAPMQSSSSQFHLPDPDHLRLHRYCPSSQAGCDLMILRS